MARTDRRHFLAGSLTAATALFLAGPGFSGPAPAFADRFLGRVRDGDLSGVTALLASDPALLGVRDHEGRSAYALALLHRHPDVAAHLLEAGHAPDVHECALALDWERFAEVAGARPGAVNLDHPIGGTAMYAAARGGAGLQIWRVYAQGGEPNVHPRGERGYSPVRAAFEEPDLATAELTAAMLLGNGAAPDLPEAGGSTALHVAAARGSRDLVEMLIRKGAPVDVPDAEGRTPVELAESGAHRDVTAMLRDHRSIPRDADSSRRAFDADGAAYAPPDLSVYAVTERGRMVGVAHGDLDQVRATLDRHPELAHAVATTTEGAVEAAAHMGRPDIADLLLDHGAPYAIPTAVMRNDLDRVRALLDEDPDRIRERGAHDFALLWYPMIGGGHREMMALLLERGADVEQQHWLGTTALHYAAVRGDVEMAELLVDHGADLNRAGRKFGGSPMTPLEIAAGRDHTALVDWLRARGARG